MALSGTQVAAGAIFGMDPVEQQSEPGKPGRAPAETDITEYRDVADSRQRLLFTALRSSDSALIFPATTAPKSASDSAPKKGRPGQEFRGGQAQPRLPIRGPCERVVHIEEIQAPLDDEAALAKLIAGIPVPDSVGPLLHHRFFGRKWDIAKQVDHWLASDGTTVVSLRISGASPSAVARLRMRFDDLLIASPDLQPSGKILHDLLAMIAREDKPPTAISAEARSSRTLS